MTTDRPLAVPGLSHGIAPPPPARRPPPRPGPVGLKESLESVMLGGVRFHVVTERQCVRFILQELQSGRGGWVVTPNLDHLRRVSHDPALAGLYADASLAVADGMPLIWASRLQGTPLPERVAGSNLICTLSAGAAEAGRSVFLLGGEAGTAELAADALRRRYPALRMAGTYCPRMGFESDQAATAALTEAVCSAAPDIVYVALGSPKQERLIIHMRRLLPCAWWLGVGISFSFLSGRIVRAPLWMQRAGLEWVHRLRQEPARLAKRYLLHCAPFAVALLGSSAMHRVFNGVARRGAARRAAAEAELVEVSGEAPMDHT